ncbi:MAG: hypothetical protein HOP08_18645 [Cyclobacteriaceae bacterium]|nr:hypothetical protein [Cyclobacteriaceae bacterium]
MKKSFQLGLLLILLSPVSYATIRTVSNDAINPAQFTTIQNAINASTSGDTVYVNVSATQYTDFIIDRKIILIGGGYKTNSQFHLITWLGNITFKATAGNDPSGSIIEGCRITFISIAAGTLPVNDIKLFRNSITTIATAANPSCENWNIYNNIIGGVDGGYNSKNVKIQNNIIVGGVSFFFDPATIIDHNVFHNAIFLYVGNSTITNNIFTTQSIVMRQSVVDNNTFNNNLYNTTTVGNSPPYDSFEGTTNTGGGNFVGVDPLYESVANFEFFNDVNNYRLKSGSPVRNAATDGSDLGIYGGAHPFPSGGAPGSGYDLSALPAIPEITSADVQNSSIQPTTLLRVRVKATVH